MRHIHIPRSTKALQSLRGLTIRTGTSLSKKWEVEAHPSAQRYSILTGLCLQPILVRQALCSAANILYPVCFMAICFLLCFPMVTSMYLSFTQIIRRLCPSRRSNTFIICKGTSKVGDNGGTVAYTRTGKIS